jgi:O-antigen/teichoic acid export membrane protein
MGVVIRQSFFTSLISYAGVVLGYINLLYLYPKFLDLGQIGLLRTILDFAMLMAFFAQVGLSQSVIRFYPHFVKDEKNSPGFTNLVLLLGVAGYLIFLILFFIFEDKIISFFGENAELLTPYLHLALALTLIISLINLMESVARTQLKLAVPRFLNEVGIRFLQGVLVTLYFVKIISFHQLLLFSVAIFLITLLALVFYLARTGQFKIQATLVRIPAAKFMQFINYSLFSLVSSGAFILVSKLDSLMVTALIGFEANAIYTTAFYMATVIEIPRRALSQANSTLMARAFEQQALPEVSALYTKTSINQFIIGALLLIGVWANLHNIYQLMPNGELYQTGFTVVLIIGAAKLLDMTFGPNSELLVMSQFYWLNTLAIMTMAIIGVTLNYLLIPVYGIEGAAYGSGIAILLFNLIKLVFIYIKFKLQPFTGKTLVVLAIGLATVILAHFLPVLNHPILDMAYRSFLITLLFAALILLTKSSAEINQLVKTALTKFW